MHKYFKEFCKDTHCHLQHKKDTTCEAYVCTKTARQFFEWYTKKLQRSKELEQQVSTEWKETGSKLQAVKKHREITGSGLRAAKDYCDKIEYKVSCWFLEV